MYNTVTGTNQYTNSNQNQYKWPPYDNEHVEHL